MREKGTRVPSQPEVATGRVVGPSVVESREVRIPSWLALVAGCLLGGCIAQGGAFDERAVVGEAPNGVGVVPARSVAATSITEVGAPGPTAGLAAGTERRLTPHLIIISIDGLRPDAIERYSARTLLRLLSEGAYTLEAETIYPSKTLPSHTSMLTGLPPSEHGVTWNSDQTRAHGVVSATTVFEAAEAEGLRTAAFFSKSKFQHLRKPGTLDHSEAPRGLNFLMATETVEAAMRYLKHRHPDLIFIHIAEPDYAGHTIGWMSSVYGWAVRRADAAVARVLAEADRFWGQGNYTVLITSDHGGHGRTHGSTDSRDMTIPWIAWGHGVRAGELPARTIRTMDTAATALWLLGLERPAAWVGRPVEAAFLGSGVP